MNKDDVNFDPTMVRAIALLHEQRQNYGVNIGGSMYSMVKDRIELFRLIWGLALSIETEVLLPSAVDPNLYEDGTPLFMKCYIRDKSGDTIATGHAMGRVSANDIDYNALVESVETKSIGRALAVLGLHGGEFASDAEMAPVQRRRESGSVSTEAFDPPPPPPPPPPMGNISEPVQTQTGMRRPQPDHGEGFTTPEPVHDEQSLANGLAEVEDNLSGIDSIHDLPKYWEVLAGWIGNNLSEGDADTVRIMFDQRYDELVSMQSRKKVTI